MNTQTVEQKYPVTKDREAVISKDWAAGTSETVEDKEFIFAADYKSAKSTVVAYPPAWLKTFDEVLVNAIDHYVNCFGTKTPVTYIKATFDMTTGRMVVSNDGPGVETAWHKDAGMYVPQHIFGTLHQGSNVHKSKQSITGGTNGLGAKLSNCFSTKFTVETVSDGTYYLQNWWNHMEFVDEKPVREPVSSMSKLPLARLIPHTTLAFVPDYAGIFKCTVTAQMMDLIRTRMVYAAEYCRYFGGKCNVLFNGEPCADINIVKTLFPAATTIATSLKFDEYTWEVNVAIVKSKEHKALSVINGIVVRDGAHIAHVRKMVVDAIKTNMSKILNPDDLKTVGAFVRNNIFVFITASIPGVSWTGQRKDVLVCTPAGRFKALKFSSAAAEALTAAMHGLIMQRISGGSITGPKKSITCLDLTKYTAAKFAGHAKKSSKCALIGLEGDSAKDQAAIGVSNCANLGTDYYGLLSLGGVIVNVRKQSTITDVGGQKYVKCSDSLSTNKFMLNFLDIMGLKMEYRYDPSSATYDREMKKLRYGSFIAGVDQDLDGIGNILGLILSMFGYYWPHLINAGFLKQFVTPLRRAYPKRGGKVIELYNEFDYADFLRDHNGGEGYEVQYYKGFGTHSRDETIQMFKSFQKNLMVYTFDDCAPETFETYFGCDPNLRKIELSKPLILPGRELVLQWAKSNKITCTDHLNYNTKPYQIDNIARKLDSPIDGLNQSGRKILNGCIKAFGGGSGALKIANLGGLITHSENYHHGEDSLAKSITGKGFITVGGKQLPIILPQSNFGSRKGGGSDAAKPRYIFGKLNRRITELIYPVSDFYILEFNFDEGKRSEPKVFIPVIPMAVIESVEIPGHGWKLTTYGRDVFDVIKNVRRLINGGTDRRIFPMAPFTNMWNGRIGTIRGKLHSFGTYTINSPTSITITELPLRVWTNNYLKTLLKKSVKNPEIIKTINDRSDDRRIRIEIDLEPGAMDILEGRGDKMFTDGIEEFFTLYSTMKHHLNMLNIDGRVISFPNYEAIIMHWFPIRRDHYALRIARQSLLMELSLVEQDQIIRYVNESESLGVYCKSHSIQCAALAEKGFLKIDHGMLVSPKYEPTDMLRELIFNGKGASFDYLLDLSDRKKSTEALAAFIEKREKTAAELVALTAKAAEGSFTGAAIWLDELDRIEEVVRLGLASDWKFGEHGKFTFD